MHGIQRLPALMFSQPEAELADLNLNNYEVLPTEPMRDISNHIKNLYAEVRKHIKEDKVFQKDTYTNTFSW